MGTVGRGAAVRRGVRLGRAAAGPLVLAVFLVTGLHPQQPASTARPLAPGAAEHSVTRCDGVASGAKSPGVTDTRAVVRTPQGEVHVVSFERGWAVFNGRAPGTFLRVCVA